MLSGWFASSVLHWVSEPPSFSQLNVADRQRLAREMSEVQRVETGDHNVPRNLTCN